MLTHFIGRFAGKIFTYFVGDLSFVSFASCSLARLGTMVDESLAVLVPYRPTLAAVRAYPTIGIAEISDNAAPA